MIVLARSSTISRMRCSLASNVADAHLMILSSTGICRRSRIIALNSCPSKGAISSLSSCLRIAPFATPPRRSSSKAAMISPISRDAPMRMRPSPPEGALRNLPIAPATSMRCTRRATTLVVRKLVRRKLANVRPSRSLLFGMIAVCGMGMPKGCLKSAVTANQSARPPTIPASAKALKKPQ